MSEALGEQETEVLEEDQPQVDSELETDAKEDAPEGEDSKPVETEEEAEEVVISFKGETPAPDDVELVPEKAKAAFAEMRVKNRELQNRLKELEANQQKPQTEQSIVVGERPNPVDYEVWDDAGKAKFDADLDAWMARKAQAQQQEQQKRAKAEEAQKAWQATVEGYQTQAKALKVPDFADAEDVVKASFSEVQQGILLQGAKGDAAKLVYALGKSESQRQKLAAIQDPVQFAFEIGRLSTEVAVTPKTKPKTSPEPTVKSTAPSAGLQSLESLLAKAEKTGDYSAYSKALKDAKNRK